MSTIYLVEITGKYAGSTTVFRYCTGAGYVTKPGDTPANTWYEGRVVQPYSYERSCHGGAKTFGLAGVGYGLIELSNADGGMDSLIDYAFDGQSLLILQGDELAAKSTFTPVYVGTMDQLTVSLDKAVVRVRDVLQNLDVPLQTTKFAGSNVLPNGLEGVAADLKGKPKPICLGWVYNVTPPQVNTARLIFQVHYAQANAWPGPPLVPMSLAVYDKRVPITAGSEKTIAQFGSGATLVNFTVNTATDVVTTSVANGYGLADGVSVLSTGGTLPAPLSDALPYFVRILSPTTFTLHPTKADAQANTNIIDITTAGSGTLDISNNRTPAGCFDWCNDASGVFFRLGSAPVGQVTCDAVNPSLGGYNLGTPGDLFRALCFIGANAQPVSIFPPVPTFDTAHQSSTTGGIYIDSETTLIEALRSVMDSGSYYLDAGVAGGFAGTVVMGRVGYQSTTSLTLTESDIIEMERVTSEDADRGIPAWRVNLQYKKNYTVMSREQIAGSVSEADIAFCAQEYRTTSAEASIVKSTYPNSPEINRTTLINDATEAAAEALRVLQTYQVRRDIYRIKVDASTVAANQLGQRVSITHSRFGLSGGGLFWILSISPNRQEETADLLVWK